MNISVTVGILILTVFLSLSAPAYAEDVPRPPYTIYDYANYTNGTPAADGELVTLYKLGDPLNNTTVEVGVSFGSPGWWKANVYDIPTNVNDGDTIVIEVIGKSTTHTIDTSLGSMVGELPSETPPANDNGGSSSNTGGTYPPTPTATPAPTAAPDPTTVAPTDTPTTVAPTEEHTKAPTAATEIEETEEEFKTESTPGFGAVLTVFAIAGLLVATYLVMRRRE